MRPAQGLPGQSNREDVPTMTDEEREKLRVQMIEELRAVVWAYIPIDSKPEERVCTAMFDATGYCGGWRDPCRLRGARQKWG